MSHVSHGLLSLHKWPYCGNFKVLYKRYSSHQYYELLYCPQRSHVLVGCTFRLSVEPTVESTHFLELMNLLLKDPHGNRK